MRVWISLLLCPLIFACHSPGQYGHSRVYSPLDAEEAALKGAKEFDPVMAQRKPEDWRGKPVSFFGIVMSRTEGPAGTEDLKLSVRGLEERNLCQSSDEASCRVTVGERERSIAHARVLLSADDAVGKLSIGVGSLVRVVGLLEDGVSPQDGSPIVRATYYRHWPRNYFVTTAQRGQMLR